MGSSLNLRFPHALSLKRSFADPPIFFSFLKQVTRYLTAVKILKEHDLSTGKISLQCPSKFNVSGAVFYQEPITRSLQLLLVPVAAFSQTDIFLV